MIHLGAFERFAIDPCRWLFCARTDSLPFVSPLGPVWRDRTGLLDTLSLGGSQRGVALILQTRILARESLSAGGGIIHHNQLGPIDAR